MGIKIAFPTDDGEIINRHFGQAKYFKVFTQENNQITAVETREKASHLHGDHSHGEGVHPGQQMVETIADCQVLISGGMGMPAYQRAAIIGLRIIMTRQSDIDAVLQAYLAGDLRDEPDLIHNPHR